MLELSFKMKLKMKNTWIEEDFKFSSNVFSISPLFMKGQSCRSKVCIKWKECIKKRQQRPSLKTCLRCKKRAPVEALK